ncbi:tetratricopeptide (TPR) repeat protein [Nocardia sp. GAS34]
MWCGAPDGRTDAALVHVTAPDWPIPVLEPVLWGRTVTHRPGIPCVMWGLPGFVQLPDGSDEVEQPTGTLNPGDGYISDRYVVKLAGTPPDDGTASPWRGISGAALYCENLLAGVVAADPAHRGHAALTAVPAYMLLRDPEFRSTVEHFAGSGSLRCESIELQTLMDHQSPIRSTTAMTPGSLLAARRAIVPFRGRQRLLAELREWASQLGLGVWLLHGSGGQGKTRLAHYFGEQLADDGWAVLWLNHQATGDQLVLLGQMTLPLLVVVDYSETRGDQLVALLNELASRRASRPVKVLLLARVVGDWWEQAVAGSESAAGALEQARVTMLAPLEESPPAQEQSFRAAVDAFASALSDHDNAGSAHATGTDWTAAASAVRLAPVFEPGTTALGVQMSALVELLDTVTQDVAPSDTGLEDRLLGHERRYWATTAAIHGVNILGPATLKDIIAATIVLAPVTPHDLDRVLTRIPDLKDQSKVLHGKTRDWLMSLYQGQTPDVFGGLGPDRVAERLIGRLMLDHTRPCIIDTLATASTITNTEAQHLLTVCTRAATHPSLVAIGNRITAWCETHPYRLMPAAIHIATRIEEPTPLVAAVNHLTGSPTTSTDILVCLHDSLPNETRVLAEAALSVALVLARRRQNHANLTIDDKNLSAESLHNLSIRLADVGQQRLALGAAMEAVDLYWQLAGQQGVSSPPNLVMSLNNLAIRLADIGKQEEALTVAAEAVELTRQLAAATPHDDRYLTSLATSTNNLSNQLADMGRREPALAAAREAVDLNRRLVAFHRNGRLLDLARRDLAISMNNLCNRLADVGRREEALAAAFEAVDLYRRLATQTPDAHLPGFATATSTLAAQLADGGRLEEALAAATEAVDHYRQLTRQHPDRFRPGLARALNNLAADLADAGRHEEALVTATEAVDHYRQLTRQHPDRFRPGLARALNNLAADLADAGRHEEALVTATEAVDHYRQLAGQTPDVHLPGLALGVNNLAIRLMNLDREDEALAAVSEAIKIRRQLAAGHRSAFLPDLATSVYDRAFYLGRMGRRDEALVAAAEAIDLYRWLTEQLPSPYATELDRAKQLVMWLQNLDVE